MCQLPEGYKRVDYLRLIPEPLYEISGFNSQEEAAVFIENLNALYPSNKYHIRAEGHFEPDDFVVIFPKGAIEFLTEDNKTNMIEFKPNLQVECFSPRIYRFMDEKYIDEFLSTGSLFISSFKRCLSLENEDRKDESEGKVKVLGHDGRYTVKMAIGVPNTSFLLCTSLSENNIMPGGNEYSHCLEILDSDKFIDMVTLALIENGYQVNRVLCGPCNYGERLITNSKTNLDIQELLQESDSNTIDFEKVFSIPNAVAGDGMYFRKGLDKAFEHEFRIIWDINNCDNDHIIVKVPDAIRYCQKKSF